MNLVAARQDLPVGGLSPLYAELASWTASQALAEIQFERFYDSFCSRLVGIGVPIRRAHFSAHTLHPLFEATGCTWERGHGCAAEDYVYEAPEDRRDRWLHSPFRHMIDHQIPMMRRRLTGDDAMLDYPVLEEFRDAGVTDWLGFLTAFDSESKSGMVGSWATDAPNGFSDSQIAGLQFLQQPFAVAIKVAAQQRLAENVVHTYLGPVAGQRVLDGQIRRGDGEGLPAVIWYSDLRGSTQMAEAMGRDAYLAILNSYFEAMGGAISAAGGELLDFIGDAVLAIFPVENGAPEDACQRALDAATCADESLARLNAERADANEAPLAFGLALHLGEVMFGNIGTQDRLVFSVIGSTVNEVARLQDMTKSLDRHVLFSGAFADALERPWHDLGKHTLPGVGSPMKIFGFPDSA